MGQLCGKKDYSPDGVSERKPRKNYEVVRFFMAGRGSAGKSTIIRHLKYLCTKNSSYKYCNEDWTEANPNDSDDDLWKRTIRASIIKALDVFIKEAANEKLELATESLKEFAATIENLAEDEGEIENLDLTEDFTTHLLELLEDPAIVGARNLKNKLSGNIALFDGLNYFLEPEKLKEVFAPEYVASEPDRVHGRLPTTGVHRYYFMLNRIRIEIYDSGGQASEVQKIFNHLTKWNTGAVSKRNFILFVASLADYNVPHPSLEKETMLNDAAAFMHLLLNNDHTRHCGLLIFFNKKDRFLEKMADPACRDDIKYIQGLSEDEVKKYVEKGRFREHVMINAASKPFVDYLRSEHSDINSYSRDTCAIDPNIMNTFYEVIRKEILNETISSVLP
uniref:G-protein alpha subunit n=1 Tax=Panagrellus redivivus TaxID=6233 RepID=A0A7E4UTW5_PANRE